MEEKKKQQNKFCVACYKFLNLVNSNFTFSNEIYQYNAQRKSSLTYFLSILKFILQIHRSQLSNCQSCKRNWWPKYSSIQSSGIAYIINKHEEIKRALLQLFSNLFINYKILFEKSLKWKYP
jgi:hypothetical protein